MELNRDMHSRPVHFSEKCADIHMQWIFTIISGEWWIHGYSRKQYDSE